MTASTIQELLREGEARLRSRGLDSPRLDAELLLAHVTGLDRLRLFTSGQRRPEPEQIARFEELLNQRSTHKPVAQILGYRDFYNARFRVSPAVLIPRPETEELVEFALQTLMERAEDPDPGEPSVLDLCCGSGCIGLSLALERPELRVDLTDISPDALDVARENADAILGDAAHQVRFFQGDLFRALPTTDGRPYTGILCNPPYIHPDESESLDRDVRDFEPHLALFHEDPAGLYASIVEQARGHLEPVGFLGLELAPRWVEISLREARRHFQEAEIRRDLSGLERFLIARRPK